MKRAETADGFTLIELLIVVAIIGIIAAIAIPGLLRARWAADEASAIGSMRTIYNGQATYSATCGNGYYAPTLEELGTPPEDSSRPQAFVGPDLGTAGIVVKSRYVISMAGAAVPVSPRACTGLAIGQSSAGYWATAEPVGAGGWRYFAVNTLGAIYEHTAAFGAVPEHADPAVGAPIR
jgi:type IV pilus assembly protein PilA